MTKLSLVSNFSLHWYVFQITSKTANKCNSPGERKRRNISLIFLDIKVKEPEYLGEQDRGVGEVRAQSKERGQDHIT